MNRKDFQALAQVRLREAQALLANGLPDGAYYLCGYAVECALKACIAKKTLRHDFPPDPRTLQSIYTHELSRLIDPARLTDTLAAQQQADRIFARNWTTVRSWSEQSRYSRHTTGEAQDLYTAIADRQRGVLQWIRRYW
ncbi:MAG TPA: HEPN domain-containing protein [Chloroflexota bacterium]